jgi:hypothetical protein
MREVRRNNASACTQLQLGDCWDGRKVVDKVSSLNDLYWERRWNRNRMRSEVRPGVKHVFDCRRHVARLKVSVNIQNKVLRM